MPVLPGWNTNGRLQLPHFVRSVHRGTILACLRLIVRVEGQTRVFKATPAKAVADSRLSLLHVNFLSVVASPRGSGSAVLKFARDASSTARIQLARHLSFSPTHPTNLDISCTCRDRHYFSLLSQPQEVLLSPGP